MSESVTRDRLSLILGISPEKIQTYVSNGVLYGPSIERYVGGGGIYHYKFHPDAARRQIDRYVRDNAIPKQPAHPSTLGEGLRSIITRECNKGKARHKAKGQPPVIEYADGKKAVVPAVQRLIDEAVSLGKITKCPPMASPEPQSNVRMKDGRVGAGRASA